KHRISTRGVKNLVLSGYAINFLPEIHGASDLEELIILDVDRRCFFESFFSFDTDFRLCNLERLMIGNCAIDVLKIRKIKDRVLEYLRFVPREEENFSYLKARYLFSPIDIGRVRERGFFVPEEVRQILKYTLVDDEGVEKKKTGFIW
ncbi:MAG: uncharacterized protein A8A55_3450, partial [Amphiamblys sp. WSBS2006]